MIDLKHPKPGAVFTCILFFLRRIVFVVGVIFLIDYPVFQILCYIFPTLMLLILIGVVEPFPSKQVNRLEMYNNCTVITLSYCLYCFTPWVADPAARY